MNKESHNDTILQHLSQTNESIPEIRSIIIIIQIIKTKTDREVNQFQDCVRRTVTKQTDDRLFSPFSVRPTTSELNYYSIEYFSRGYDTNERPSNNGVI